MGVSSPRDDRAERNLGVASFPLSTAIPRAGNAHQQQNPISDSYILSLRHRIFIKEEKLNNGRQPLELLACFPLHLAPFEKEFTLKGKNLLLKGKFVSLRIDFYR